MLFRGNAEAVVRRNLVQRGYIKAIVGLPTNLFFGTGIPACLVVIDKRDSASRTGIFMINAAAGFTKDGAKNRLREQDIHRIIDTYRRQADVPGYARLVPVSEIADPKNDFNLNLPRYIESTEKEDIQDLAGHMRGGIPSRDVDALEKYWKVAPGLRATLFEEAAQTGYWALRVPSESIRATISAHPEFGAFRDHVAEIFEQWRALNEPLLRSFDLGGRPKEFIATLSESLLERFGSVELFDPYDIYQGLMSYWSQTFQDDAYMVAADGWVEAVKPREIFQQRNKNNKLEWMEEEEFRLDRRRFKSDLLPASILIDAHLSTDRDRLDQATSEKERLEQEIGAEKEEHAVEGGLLEDVAEFDEDKVKVDIAVVNRWLRENGEDPEVAEEAGAIRRIKGLLDDLKRAKDEMKDATKDLDARVAALYAAVPEAEIRDLVIRDKWLAAIEGTVSAAVSTTERALTARVIELDERYSVPLPTRVETVSSLAKKVEGHLTAMGVR